MATIVQEALFRGASTLILLVVLTPVAILSLGWLLYIVIEGIRELIK